MNNRRKKKYEAGSVKKQKKWKASITVEASFVVPLVLFCIFLFLIINGYLHDTVILNGMAAEVLYADEEKDAETLFHEETEKRILWLRQIEFSETEDPFHTVITWKTVYTLPIQTIMQTLTGEKSVELDGKVGRQSWNMARIIRYINQN